MKPSQTIFNRDNNTVTISEKEYNRLLQYKQIALDFQAILKGDDQ
jgi:hypothetical protein